MTHHDDLRGDPAKRVKLLDVVSYCLGWLKPLELQWLVQPPSIARRFSPELAVLVGYAQHFPNLGNVEGQSPSFLLRDEVTSHLRASDALRPDPDLN